MKAKTLQAPLFPYQCPALLVSPNDGIVRQVWLHDISEHGIGVCWTESLPLGTSIVISLKHPPYGPLNLRATVAHSTEMGPDDWRIGCEFATPITPELLDGLL